MTTLFRPFCSLLLISLITLAQAHALPPEKADRQIQKYLKKGAIALNSESGERLISINEEQILLPASIVKIITSMFALDLLGENFRFRTEFYLDSQKNLTIKGYGDPFLISEEIRIIANRLKEKGVQKITQLFLDSTAFSAPIVIPGTSQSLNPYDALNGALAVNFNTLNIGRTKQGRIYSAEKETPLTPLARKKSKRLQKGKKDRISLAAKPAESLQYAGELFSELFSQAGIQLQKYKIGIRTLPSDGRLVYRHYSTHSLRSILAGLLKYSNNYIANQIFLIIGARERGFPASLEKSRAVFRNYIKKKLPPMTGELILEEASGLSRNNRITADYMMKVLELFRKDYQLIHKRYGAYLKSGTLTGVYNYAGYIETPKGLRPFVVILNQAKNRRLQLVQLLKKIK